MPDKLLIAQIIELTLFVVGLVLLWRFVLSSTARQRAGQPSPLPHWDIPGYVYALTILRVLGVAVTFQLLVGSFVKKFMPGQSLTEGLGLIISGLSLQVGLLIGLGVAWFFLKSTRFQALLNAASTGSKASSAPMAWSRVPLAGLATFAVMIALIAPITLFWPPLLKRAGFPVEPQEAVELFTKAGSSAQLALMILFAVVIAPITEELLFRTGIFRYVRGRLPRFLAYALPALIFAVAHRSLTAGLPLFVFGIIQSIAYERTGRIAVPMIAHGLFNLHTAAFLLTGIDPFAFITERLSR
jgi:uncharacterized protein